MQAVQKKIPVAVGDRKGKREFNSLRPEAGNRPQGDSSGAVDAAQQKFRAGAGRIPFGKEGDPGAVFSWRELFGGLGPEPFAAPALLEVAVEGAGGGRGGARPLCPAVGGGGAAPGVDELELAAGKLLLQIAVHSVTPDLTRPSISSIVQPKWYAPPGMAMELIAEVHQIDCPLFAPRNGLTITRLKWIFPGFSFLIVYDVVTNLLRNC